MEDDGGGAAASLSERAGRGDPGIREGVACSAFGQTPSPWLAIAAGLTPPCPAGGGRGGG